MEGQYETRRLGGTELGRPVALMPFEFRIGQFGRRGKRGVLETRTKLPLGIWHPVGLIGLVDGSVVLAQRRVVLWGGEEARGFPSRCH